MHLSPEIIVAFSKELFNVKESFFKKVIWVL